MRRLCTLITILLLAAVVLPLGTITAQDPDPVPPADSLGDSYYPQLGNSGYDVQHYDLALTADVATNTLTGTATITARSLAELRTFNLDFVGLDVDYVAVNDVAVDWDREPHELIVVPLAPLPADETFTVTVVYSGVPEGVEMSGIPMLTGWVNYGTGVFVASEPGGAASWYPVNDHPLDKATYSLSITVPEPYIVAANGVLTGTTTADGQITTQWEMDQPMASYLATVNIDQFEVFEEQGPDGIAIRNYFPADIAQAAQFDFSRTPDMIAFFQDTFGPYPFETYGVVVADTRFGFALETQSLSLFSRNWISGEGHAEEAVAHELAHQWYGNSVSLSQWQDIWLNEGFATYISWLWFEHDRGADYLDQTVRTVYADILEDEASFSMVVSKQNLLDALAALPLDAITYPATVPAELTRLLLQNAISNEEIETFIAGFPQDDITGRELELMLSALPFNAVNLSGAELHTLRTLLAMDIYPARHAYQLPASTYLAPGNAPYDDLFNRGVYLRGALVLHALRMQIGDEAFFAIMRTYYEQFRDGNATIAGFIAIAETASGQSLGDFFDAWLYAAEVPDIPEMDLTGTVF